MLGRALPVDCDPGRASPQAVVSGDGSLRQGACRVALAQGAGVSWLLTNLGRGRTAGPGADLHPLSMQLAAGGTAAFRRAHVAQLVEQTY